MRLRTSTPVTGLITSSPKKEDGCLKYYRSCWQAATGIQRYLLKVEVIKVKIEVEKNRTAENAEGEGIRILTGETVWPQDEKWEDEELSPAETGRDEESNYGY